MTDAAIVTGGARGIGRAVGAALAARGLSVVVADLDGDAAAQSAADLGPAVRGVALDVTDPDAIDALVRETAAAHGRLAWMVNNAGVAVAGGFEATGLDDWRRVVDVNLFGVVHGALRGVTPEQCARVILRGVRRNRGIIPVTAVTHIEWRLYRFAPWLLGPVLRARARTFRRYASGG